MRKVKRIKPIYRLLAVAITAVMCTLMILSAVFPFPEGQWDFLSIGIGDTVFANPSFTARTETYFDAASLSSPYDFTLDKPTNTAEGDILFTFISWRDFSGFAVDAVPDGWTLVADNTDDNHKFALYYKVAGDSEPSDYTWSLDGSAQLRATCSCYTGGDFDTGDPIDVVSNTDYEGADTTVRAASMTVSAANSPLVFFAGAYHYSGSVTFTKPSAPTTDWVEDDDAGSSASDWWHEVCSMIWSGSGATGNMDATASQIPYQNNKHAFAVALNPAAAGEPSINNTPDNYGFGILTIGTASNTTINYFTITNNGTIAVDITIQGTNLTGGDDTWVLSPTATPGENIYGLMAGLDDADDLFDTVVNLTANAFVTNLAESATQNWGLNLSMPSSLSGFDGNNMTGTITLIASAA